MEVTIRQAGEHDAELVTVMVKALTDEIIERTGGQHFHVEPVATAQRCRRFIANGAYAVLIAESDGDTLGFAALCESHALYAEGSFGIVQEFYVRPAARSHGVGQRLVEAAVAYAGSRGWTRLELCTPPLPEFDRTLDFYQRQEFEVTGGRKMKRIL